MNIDRKLATVRLVSDLRPIKGADRIELATVDGWQVVVKKGEFEVGDPAIYFEIDSWVPHDVAPFLTKPGHEPKMYQNVLGQRLKTMRMKGELSQGLLLPPAAVCTSEFPAGNLLESDDLTELLGVLKWERPLPANLAGTVKGNFPSFLPRTDQPRIQNVFRKVEDHVGLFEVTEKLDGSSMTVYWSRNDCNDPVSGVCSRNLDLKQDENNAFWQVAIRDGLISKIEEYGENMALQGELVGPGIQGNPYQLIRLEFYVFDIFSVDDNRYMSPRRREEICRYLGLQHVPIIGYDSLVRVGPESVTHETVASLLNKAEGPSLLNSKTQREGVVWKDIYGDCMSFKVISNLWLLGEKE